MKRQDGIRPNVGQLHRVESLFIDKKKTGNGYMVAASVDGKIITSHMPGNRPTEKDASAHLIAKAESVKK